jgi:cytochrome P450
MAHESVGPALAKFPAARQCPFDPPRQYIERREREPVFQVRLPTGKTAWLITRHEDARAVMEDRQMSADMSHPNFPSPREHTVRSPLKGTFMRSDGQAHYRIRKMLNQEFTVRAAEAMRPMITEIVDGLLEEMENAGPPTDLVEALALPVPSTVICRMLGVPYEDHDVFQKRTRAMINTKSTPKQVRTASMEMFRYLDALVEHKMHEPDDDLVSRLIRDQVQPGHLDRRELTVITLLLLAGGHDTTGAMTAFGTLTLLQHPTQLEELKADPSLIPGAVEELLRYLTVAQLGTFRVATEDVEIGGKRIPAGDGVVVLLNVANRDELAFPDPDAFDIHRNARGHVAFAHGPHHCLGQSLARVELQVVLTRILTRFPTLRLAVPVEEITYRPHTIGLAGVVALPVAW